MNNTIEAEGWLKEITISEFLLSFCPKEPNNSVEGIMHVEYKSIIRN